MIKDSMDTEYGKQAFIEQFRIYIASVRWQEARTYARFAPHEYTVSDWNPNRRAWFEEAVMGIRRYGYDSKFGSATYVYLDVDGKKYWTMGAALSETVLINRASVSVSDYPLL